VGNLANNGFDPKAFLAKVGAGKTILKFEKNQHVFEQGDVAVRFFTFKKAASSSLSYPSKVRKR
jgi:CRP/FNR family cyclic AMP-dependent transcriptional regulator